MNIETSFELKDFKDAKSRISSTVRRTPLFSAEALIKNPLPDGKLSLKLENLQPTGSFKVHYGGRKY